MFLMVRNQVELFGFSFQGTKMETVNSDTSSSSTESCEGVFHLGNNILVVRFGSDSEDDIISISDDEDNHISDQNVSSTVPNVGPGVEDNVSVPTGSENISINLKTEASESPKIKDSLLEIERKPIIVPGLENISQEALDNPPESKKVLERATEDIVEEIFPVPPEYRFPDEEVAGVSFVSAGPSGEYFCSS